MIKFYNRKEELNTLIDLEKQSQETGRMTVITGRRRVGKTVLALHYAQNKPCLYFFISRKSETQLCDEFLSAIKERFDVPVIGEIKNFKDIFKLLLTLSERKHLILIIDEFQEFYHVNPSVYSEIQNLWDLHRKKSRMHLIFIGSVYSLMVNIFENSKEPLFGRADRNLYIKPFTPHTIKTILTDYRAFTLNNLFVLYIVTGGIPRYLEILAENNALSQDEIFDFILQKNSPFLFEGRHLLIEELGKEHGIYFSILELISTSKTSRSEIESIIGKNVGGHLDRLETIYGIIEKIKPINARRNSRVQKYMIKDNFLNFWFRFIQKNRSAVETENFDYIKKIIKRDFRTFSGVYLEKLFQELLRLKGNYNKIGNYWEKGNQNEIDIAAVNDMDKKLLIAEVKINPDKIDQGRLKKKSARLVDHYKGYTVEYAGLSIRDLSDYL
ncbi:MAG: ATP-binding protein [Thermodesulfobacteriota bacterium]|nr:ATP-binding protein [Thermodesulfobacteriota bacterium]